MCAPELGPRRGTESFFEDGKLLDAVSAFVLIEIWLQLLKNVKTQQGNPGAQEGALAPDTRPSVLFE